MINSHEDPYKYPSSKSPTLSPTSDILSNQGEENVFTKSMRRKRPALIMFEVQCNEVNELGGVQKVHPGRAKLFRVMQDYLIKHGIDPLIIMKQHGLEVR